MAKHLDEKGYAQGYAGGASARRMERRAERVARFLSSQDRVLELGCGSGELTAGLSLYEFKSLRAIDLSEKLLAQARQRVRDPRVIFEQVDVHEMKDLGTYQAIVGNGILHHLNLPEVLPRLFSFLEPGGKLLFWEPNLYNPYVYFIFRNPLLRKWALLEPSEMAFSRPFIRSLLQNNGFEVRVEYRDFLLPNTPKAFVPLVEKWGAIFEKTPLAVGAQSLFIVATKSDQF